MTLFLMPTGYLEHLYFTGQWTLLMAKCTSWIYRPRRDELNNDNSCESISESEAEPSTLIDGTKSIIEPLPLKLNKGVEWLRRHPPDLPFPLIIHVCYSGLMWSFNLLFWIVGLQYTTTFKASVLANVHPILLVVCFAVMGTPVAKLEWAGVLISFGGIFIISLAERGDTDEGTRGGRKEVYGLILCFLAAVAEVLVLFNRIKTQKMVPLLQVC